MSLLTRVLGPELESSISTVHTFLTAKPYGSCGGFFVFLERRLFVAHDGLDS